MTIKEMEMRSGLDRTNIRFYEREGLIEPERKENGYRNYRETDLQLLLKIKLLRRLGFSLDAIRALKEGTTGLDKALSERLERIDMQRQGLNATEQICQGMRKDRVSFDTLDAKRYLEAYDLAMRPTYGMAVSVPDGDRIEPVRCPWRRFFARTLDLSMAAILLYLPLALILRMNISETSGFVSWMILVGQWIILIPLEALCLSRIGTTPGKWIFGIWLEHDVGRRLTFGEAAHRGLEVFYEGEGLGIPIIALWQNWKAYKAIKGDGAKWDENVTIVVKENRWWRPAAFAAAYVCVLLILVTIANVPAMPINRGSELTVAEFVENYNQLAKFHDLDYRVLENDGTFRIKKSTIYDTMEEAKISVLKKETPMILQFTEEDGVLTEVSFTQKTKGSILATMHCKETILLTGMAFGWSDGNMIEAQRTTKSLKKVVEYMKDGAVEVEVLNCQVKHIVRFIGNDSDESGQNYEMKFWIDT